MSDNLEEPMDTGDSSIVNASDEEGNRGRNEGTNSLDYDQSNCQADEPDGTSQKKNTTTIHLSVVWLEGKGNDKMKTLEKALQSWLSKKKIPTECSNLIVSPVNGSVKVDIMCDHIASVQEDLLTQETVLVLRDQQIAKVKRVMPADLVTVSCNVPLVHFWYLNQVYREEISRIEKENGVQANVTVSFSVDPSTEGDPHKACSELSKLQKSCSDDFNCFTYTHELGQVDWDKTLKFIEQDQEKLTLTVSSHEVEVCGPMKSLAAFESITKMQKKILNIQIPSPSSALEAQGKSYRVSENFRDPLVSSGLEVDPVHWSLITITLKNKLTELERRFGVTFEYSQNKVKAKAKPETSGLEDALESYALESHALRALLCLYQRVVTSVVSCSVLSPSRGDIVKERLSLVPGVVPELQGDTWRIIGLPENLYQAVAEIEINLGGPFFKDEDKQRIENLRYRVEPSGRSDMADGKHPIRGATADEEEDRCPICLDSFKDKTTLKCTHMFCKGCLEQCKKKVGPICPVCKAIFGTFVGDQPDGQMTINYQQSPLPGFRECGTIMITYCINPGKQTAQHPNPGKSHQGTNRSAYLPNNKEGYGVMLLLRKAFDQKLIFTVGTSRTSGADDQVTWNDVHHKTSKYGGPESYGYPDPDYLRRVKEELKAKGIE